MFNVFNVTNCIALQRDSFVGVSLAKYFVQTVHPLHVANETTMKKKIYKGMIIYCSTIPIPTLQM